MSSTISPTSPPTIPTTLTAPSDGESANALSLTTFLSPIENGIESFRLLTYGGGIRRRVKCVDNTTMTIQPLGAVVVTVGGVWTVLVHSTASTVSPTTLAGGALTNSTRYWVYAYSAAGVLSFVADTTGPDVGLRYKNGSTDYQYVSTFFVDAAGNILPYTQSDESYSYATRSNIGGGATGNLCLDAGHALMGAPATVSIGSSLPTQAVTARLQLGISSGVAAVYSLYVGQVGSVTTTPLGEASNQSTTQPGYSEISFSLYSAYSFDYFVTNASANGYVWVAGFDL